MSYYRRRPYSSKYSRPPTAKAYFTARKRSRRGSYSSRKLRTYRASATFNKNYTIVSNREYICDINAAADFARTSFGINPGLGATFPWLSRIAANYQQYDFYKLKFIFKSTSSDAIFSTAVSSGLGVVIGATQYNASEPLFQTKDIMQNYTGSKSKKPSLSQAWKVRVKNGSNPIDKLFVRSTTIPAGSDLKFYDLGNFSVAVQGCQVPASPALPGVIGELWVEYTCKLMKPSVGNQTLMTEMWYLSTFATTGRPFGGVQTVDPNQAGIGLTFPSMTTCQFPLNMPPKKRFLFTIHYFSGSGAGTATTWAPAANPGTVTVAGGKLHNIRAAGSGIGSVTTLNPVTFAPFTAATSDPAFSIQFIVEILPTFAAPATIVTIPQLNIGSVAAGISAAMWVTEVEDDDQEA